MNTPKRTERTLNHYRETVAEIIRLSRSYKSDLGLLAFNELRSFYNIVRGLSYIRDPSGIETVVRPKYTINPYWSGPRDCDDKTVLMGAYFEFHAIPWRIAVVGKGDSPHHVYPEFRVPDSLIWLPADATYPDRCELGRRLYDERFREVFRVTKI